MLRMNSSFGNRVPVWITFSNLTIILVLEVSILTTVFCVEAEKEEDVKRFIVVSDIERDNDFYYYLRPTKPFHNEPNIDIATKAQICEDITSSYLFSRDNEYPYEENANILSRLILHRLNYPTETIRAAGFYGARYFDEITFHCLSLSVLQLFAEKYYISEEYDFSLVPTQGASKLASSAKDETRIAGRFIFHDFAQFDGMKNSFRLAEVPGKVYSSPDHNVERVYLKRRQKRVKPSEGICKLQPEEKSRICLAVHSSKNVDENVFFTNTAIIETRCYMQMISFGTDYAKNVASKLVGRIQIFSEWMLECKPNKQNKDGEEIRFDYLLSYAYERNQIFVFLRDKATGGVYPENLTVRVRL